MKYKNLIIYSLLFPFVFGGIGLYATVSYFWNPGYAIELEDIFKGIILGFVFWFFEISSIRNWLIKYREAKE